MARNSTYRELTRDEFEALTKFSESRGRRWKSRARDLWEEGRPDTETERIVYSLRNSHGPMWLKSLRLAEVGPLAPASTATKVVQVETSLSPYRHLRGPVMMYMAANGYVFVGERVGNALPFFSVETADDGNSLVVLLCRKAWSGPHYIYPLTEIDSLDALAAATEQFDIRYAEMLARRPRKSGAR